MSAPAHSAAAFRRNFPIWAALALTAGASLLTIYAAKSTDRDCECEASDSDGRASLDFQFAPMPGAQAKAEDPKAGIAADLTEDMPSAVLLAGRLPKPGDSRQDNCGKYLHVVPPVGLDSRRMTEAGEAYNLSSGGSAA